MSANMSDDGVDAAAAYVQALGAELFNAVNEVHLDDNEGNNTQEVQVNQAARVVIHAPAEAQFPVVFHAPVVIHTPATGHAPGQLLYDYAMGTDTFYIFAGPELIPFAINIHDIRNESELLRSSRSITSVELRTVRPAAAEIIYKWFRGHVGGPPITRAQRILFNEAANIAKQLEIKECEAQLLVINAKVTSVLSNIFYDQLESDLMLDPIEVHEMIHHQLRNWLRRSRNVGGDEGSESAFELL